MSCFVRIATKLTNTETIKMAAEALGYRVLKSAKKVRGYGSREAKADFVLGTKTKYDIGAIKADDGTYSFVSDWGGTRVTQKEFVRKLSQKYSYLQVLETVTSKGYVLADEKVDERGAVRLLLRKFS